MASRLLLSVLLLSALAAVPADVVDITIAGDKTWRPDCRPGHDIPIYALPRCRAYVKLACTGDEVPADMLRQCCEQVRGPSACYCAAVYHMVGSMYRELGVARGQPEAFPGCRREALKLVAASIPLTCLRDYGERLSDDEGLTCAAVLRDY